MPWKHSTEKPGALKITTNPARSQLILEEIGWNSSGVAYRRPKSAEPRPKTRRARSWSARTWGGDWRIPDWPIRTSAKFYSDKQSEFWLSGGAGTVGILSWEDGNNKIN
jgi:hypothetical protein